MKIRILLTAITLSIFALNACTSKEEKEKKVAEDKKVRKPEDDKADSLSLVYDRKKEDKWIADFMSNLHKKYRFNGNALVAKKGKIIYQGALGWADYLHRDSLKINSEFELASITKTFTGTAIMQLVEAGKLNLDDDVKKFFPNFPYDGITVRLLLPHRSGMMNYVYFIDDIWRKEKRNMKKGVTNQEVMQVIAERKPSPYTKPDRLFHYNNSNYMVLGAIIEKVTGMRYSQYMMEHIFKPAGMKNTHVYSKAEYEKIPVDVVGHDRNNFKYSVVQNFLDGPVGDKGIYSTVHDLVLFDKYLRNERLLKNSSLDSSYVGRNKPIKGHFNYGYGWRLFEEKGKAKVAYHTGWWHGFRHIYVRDLDKDIVVVFLGNLTNGSLMQLDELYKYLKIPIIRKGAYSGAGAAPGTDED
ncbi:MAG: serine hydrolase domain-containing protein [Pedobacter sp.]|uniref:serine hydrolase domain-containing protein n=1 Tax=Pedobacter sp. TaxID=1411316 RepID=UPI00280746B6|nr:serine hydrolase domain-containing protein [Pedobacter sp.]MDQ8006563.1 serine hydrolase domain-containing protein [Pedobacter sp.]